MPAATTATTTTTISEKKLAANRQNAQKSTGPRTPQGKRTASQNALRHGGFAAATLLPHEDPAAFYNFRRAFIADLCPMTAPELFLADRAVSLAWRLQRLQEADAALYTAAELNVERQLERAKANLEEQDQDQQDNDDSNAHFTYIDDDDDDDDTPTQPPLHPDTRALLEDPAGTPPIHPAYLLAASFERGPATSPFDRLTRTEQRLHNMYHRTLKELTTLQTRREKQAQNPNHHPTPCPFLPKEEPPPASQAPANDEPDTANTDPETPAQKAQNEPTESPSLPPSPQNAQNEPTAPSPHTPLITQDPRLRPGDWRE